MSKEKKLKEIIKDILWMAVRYADARHTYAPGIIRDVVRELKKMYPNEHFLKRDDTLEKPNEKDLKEPFSLEEDYLYDLVEEEFKEVKNGNKKEI